MNKIKKPMKIKIDTKRYFGIYTQPNNTKIIRKLRNTRLALKNQSGHKTG